MHKNDVVELRFNYIISSSFSTQKQRFAEVRPYHTLCTSHGTQYLIHEIIWLNTPDHSLSELKGPDITIDDIAGYHKCPLEDNVRNCNTISNTGLHS